MNSIVPPKGMIKTTRHVSQNRSCYVRDKS